MQRSDFFFDLPHHLIAQSPCESRTGSRLLYVNSGQKQFQDCHFVDFPSFLKPKDLLVFNDTRVIPARLFGHKASGGQIEILVEQILDDQQVLAQIRASKSPKADSLLILDNEIKVKVLQRINHFFKLQFIDAYPIYDILQRIGHIPLPPYIQRLDTPRDKERYQTVYAQQPGAVAAPTAGLHFDKAMLEQIKGMGIEMVFITLHIGAGTFASVRVDDLREHVMHTERLTVSAQVCEQINRTRIQGGRVIAVGTTCVRALETASLGGMIQPYQGETRLFITPGYSFRSVDALLTNFHLPESTLFMLVCAFGGREFILSAYQHAINQQYRFFSYGDAMFIDSPTK